MVRLVVGQYYYYNRLLDYTTSSTSAACSESDRSRTPTKMARGSPCVPVCHVFFLVLLLAIPYSHCSSCLDKNNLQDTAYSNGTISKCLELVNVAFGRKTVPYLSPGTKNLDVFLDITFRAPSIDYSCCCSSYSSPATFLELNPAEDQQASPVAMRTDSAKTFTLLKHEAPLFTPEFQGETHTLVMMDPDAANPAFGTPSRPFAHMVITDIENGDVTTGRVALPYLGPGPPDAKFHTYYFLLFKQPVGASFVPNLDDYSNPATCQGAVRGRCLFDMAAFIQQGGLDLVGASWVLVETSPFVRCGNVHRTSNEAGLCANVPGYANPCPH